MKKGIDHIGIFVSGICQDKEGNVLFRKRGPGARDEHGKWDPGVGGAQEFGESCEQCLFREIEEEAGIQPKSYELLGSLDKFRVLDGAETHWVGFYFKCEIDRTKVIVDPQETSEVMWAPFADFPDPMMTGFLETYETFKKYF